MIQISITLQILANVIPEIFWTSFLQALSAMIYINKKENQKTIVKDGLPRRMEETKIFGWQAFCSIFVQSLVKGQEF